MSCTGFCQGWISWGVQNGEGRPSILIYALILLSVQNWSEEASESVQICHGEHCWWENCREGRDQAQAWQDGYSTGTGMG